MSRRRMDTLPERRFSRNWWLGGGRNLLWVVVVTLLIWVYADLEFSDTAEIKAVLHLRVGSGRDMVLLDKSDMSTRELDVSFKVQGSRGSLNKYQQWLNEPNSSVLYDLPDVGYPGKLTVSIVNALNHTDALTKAGLTVISASPASVEIELARAKYLPDVEVQFRSTGETVAEAVVTPPRMGVTIAEPFWNEMSKAQVKPVLQTVSVDLQKLPRGQSVTVPIDPYVGGVVVRPDQPTVDVVVKISQLAGETKVTVPIRLLTPQSWSEDGTWDRFALKRQDPADWMKSLTFSGPKKDVERLKPEDVDAYVVLTDEDKKPVDSWLTKPVLIRLRENLPLQVVGEKPTVGLKLIPRTAPTP